jgi:hypothetical protein
MLGVRGLDLTSSSSRLKKRLISHLLEEIEALKTENLRLKHTTPKTIAMNNECLSGRCKCGAVQYHCPPGAQLWGVFFCHCSMCPSSGAESHGGVGWAGIPMPQYTGPLRETASSTFGVRGTCRECGTAIFIRYQCEDHTDWVLYKTIDAPSNSYPKDRCWHIHCKGIIEAGSGFGDGIPVCQGWACWEPNPCRPVGLDVPKVCFRCFVTSNVCECSAGPLLQQPADGDEGNVG